MFTLRHFYFLSDTGYVRCPDDNFRLVKASRASSLFTDIASIMALQELLGFAKVLGVWAGPPTRPKPRRFPKSQYNSRTILPQTILLRKQQQMVF